MTIPQPHDEVPNPAQPADAPQPGPAAQPAAAPPPPPGVASHTVGYFQAPALPKGPSAKSPAMACILSVVPGLGQIYVGYYGLGFLHAIVASSLFAIMIAGGDTSDLLPMLVVFFIFFMLYNIVDAGRRAALYNLAIAGVPGVELPQPLKVPRFGGSIFGGAVFIVAGFVLLMNTKFGYSLEWVQDWWPLAPMIFGVYLIVRAIQERATKA